LAVLSLVFRTLFNKARLTSNPWQGITRKTIKGTVNHHKELTVDELRRVCQSATGEFRTLFGIGTFTGLRLRDCATLLWSEVDMRRNCVMRTPFKTARARSDPVFIPLHPELRSMLNEVPADKRSGYVLPGMADLYLNNKRQLIEKIMSHLEGAGVTTHRTGANGKRILERGFHSLRHSFVSICREAGVPMSTVQEIVGHSSPCMTQVYTHASEAAATRAIASLPSITGEVKAPPAKASPESILSEVRAIAESIGPENLAEKKAALLAVLAGV
jgi:integrase